MEPSKEAQAVDEHMDAENMPAAIQDLKKKGGEVEKAKHAPAVQSKADWSAVRTKLEQLCVGITAFAFKGQGRGTQRCDTTTTDDEDRVFWSQKPGVESGLMAISGNEAVVPVKNDKDTPMILKENEEVGHWGSERWREKLNDLNPLVIAPNALKAVLKLAYDTCIDWTDFLCNTDAITKHAKIEGHSIERSYNEALQAFRREIEGQATKELPTKSGPVGYATFEGGSPMERDGTRGRVATKVATTFARLLDVLEEWRSYKAWVIVWPLDSNPADDVPQKMMVAAKEYLEEGGKIVTAWPPITSKNHDLWRELSGLWKTFDETLIQCDKGRQVFTTASNFGMKGKLFIEAGAPEGGAQFFNSYVGTAMNKYIYECVRRRAVDAHLPELDVYRPRIRTSRTMSPSGEGMSGPWPLKRRPM
ncbi:unnamed protein product [Cylicocyclus nassatus]|uniref:Uncharacterized protein n=1 Tax=Cylicocyclus nassatus TaxID=53992 RepID=A0AA36H6I1_CYLNA|nr:unnamed protein product [Cylicocyclus nassatus]